VAVTRERGTLADFLDLRARLLRVTRGWLDVDFLELGLALSFTTS
jgi:hypothetical protein